MISLLLFATHNLLRFVASVHYYVLGAPASSPALGALAPSVMIGKSTSTGRVSAPALRCQF